MRAHPPNVQVIDDHAHCMQVLRSRLIGAANHGVGIPTHYWS